MTDNVVKLKDFAKEVEQKKLNLAKDSEIFESLSYPDFSKEKSITKLNEEEKTLLRRLFYLQEEFDDYAKECLAKQFEIQAKRLRSDKNPEEYNEKDTPQFFEYKEDAKKYFKMSDEIDMLRKYLWNRIYERIDDHSMRLAIRKNYEVTKIGNRYESP